MELKKLLNQISIMLLAITVFMVSGNIFRLFSIGLKLSLLPLCIGVLIQFFNFTFMKGSDD